MQGEVLRKKRGRKPGNGKRFHQIVAALVEGYSQVDAAVVFGVTRQYVSHVARRAGLTYARPKSQRVLRDEAWRQTLLERWGDGTGSVWKRRRYHYTHVKNQAKRLGIPFTLKFTELYWPEVCPVLEIPLAYAIGVAGAASPSFDRMDPTLGYIPGNVKVISWRANRLKSDGTLDEHERIVIYMRS